MYAFKENGVWTPFDNHKLPLDNTDELYNVPSQWSDAEKEQRFKLFVVTEESVPPGKIAIGWSIIEDENGRPKRSLILEDLPVVIPDRVTARQFKLALLAAGYIDAVEAWVATQSRAVQIAYEYSGTFVRNEPMMQAGFTSLGFTPQQIDDFFLAASKI